MKLSATITLLALVGCAQSVDTKGRSDAPAPEKTAVGIVQGSHAVAEEYPHPHLLIEPGRLARSGIAGQFIVLDARPRKAFDAGRVPGARWVDATAWAKAFGSGTDFEAWSRRIGDLGVTRDSRVAVYDDASSKDAARAWWILRYWGVADVRLLNGGWTGWKAAALPVEADEPRTPIPVPFQATAQSQRLATKGQLLTALKDKSLQIVDARSEAEFCGIDKLKNKRGGAIPGAKHLEWIDLIDVPTQRFKSAGRLRTLFQEAGIELDKPTAIHCQSGGRASVVAFVMELMGDARVNNYYAGWAEWGNADDTPILRSHAPPSRLDPGPVQ